MLLKKDLIFLKVDSDNVIVDLTSYNKDDNWQFYTCNNSLYEKLKQHHKSNTPIVCKNTLDFSLTHQLLESKLESSDNKTPKHLHFWLQTTDKCNLNCSYCYIPSLHSNQKLDTSVFNILEKKLLEEKNLQSVSIKISGGEPTLVFNQWKEPIEKLKKTLNRHNIKLYLQLNSNLVDLDKLKYKKEITNFIKKHDVNVAVSIDGTEKNHDFYRKRYTQSKNIAVTQIEPADGTFKNVMGNIKSLDASGIKPAYLITLNSDKTSDVLPLIEEAVSNARDFRVCDVKGKNFSNENYINLFNGIYDFLKPKVINGYKLSHHMLVSDLNLHRPQKNPCSMGENGVALYMNGDLFFCHTEFQDGTAIGSIQEDESLSSIIQRSKPRQEARHQDCYECNLRKVCASGCAVYRENNKSPMCYAHKTIIPKIFELYYLEYKEKI